jgi:predicted nucleic acid-binding protein
VIHLDTNFLIRGLVEGTREARQVDRWCARGEPIAVCALAWAEFLCGSVGAPERAIALEFLGEIRAVGVADAGRAAELFHSGGRRTRSLPDCVIAACAIESRAALATANIEDFRRFVPLGLRLAE